MGATQGKHGESNKVPVIQLGHDVGLDETAISDEAAAQQAPADAGRAPEGAAGGAGAPEGGADGGDHAAEARDAPGSSVGDSGLLRELREYRLTKQGLGEGAFAKVRLATSESTGHQVAVKIIKRKKLDERAELLLQREVKHHEKLRHVNIVRLHTWIKGPTKYYLVMEYCTRGDLLQFVNRSGWLSDALARRLFSHLMEGIAFCHRLGIHHRDLKLENLLLSGADDESMVLKIADFGLSDLQVRRDGVEEGVVGR
jgi:5'-AMP-activated protein kinase catalytic alpha subunit